MNSFTYISFSLFMKIFINLSLLQLVNCHFFKKEKIDIDLKEMNREQFKQEKVGVTNECLYLKKKQKKF